MAFPFIFHSFQSNPITSQGHPSNQCRATEFLNPKSFRTTSLRAQRSAHNNSSSSEESNQSMETSKHDNEEDDDNKISMDVSPSVLRLLQGRSSETAMDGTENENSSSLIERNRRKRAARFAENKQTLPSTNSFPTAINEEECHEISRAFKLQLPRLQKLGNLDVDKILRFILQFTDLSFVIPPEILLGEADQKPLDQNLIKECMPFIFLTATLRMMGGFQFDRDKEWYSERLVLFLVYNQFVKDLAEEQKRKDLCNNIKAQKLSSTIAKLEPLVMTVVAPELLTLYAFENSGFAPDGPIVRYEDAFIFPGKLDGHAGEAGDRIQRYMDLTGQDNGVIFLKSGRNPGETWCLIAPWSWFMVTILPDSIYNWVSGFVFLGAFVGALQFNHADPGLENIVWEAIIIPGVFLSIIAVGSVARGLVASKYEVAQLLRWPMIFPFPGQGAIGAITGYSGCLPSRGCLLNLSLASVSASLALSSLILFLGYAVGSSYAFSDVAVDFHGYFLVPLDMFSYSNAFSFLLRKLSVTSFREEMGSLELVINPLALSGLLGLNFCSFQLLPVSRFDGARILSAVLGRHIQKRISVAVQILLTLCFMLKNPLLGLAWLGYIFVADRYDDLFQREEVTEPPLHGKLLGLGLVTTALASFVPALW
eukprot:Gb_24922 [translate_table: standard]